MAYKAPILLNVNLFSLRNYILYIHYGITLFIKYQSFFICINAYVDILIQIYDMYSNKLSLKVVSIPLFQFYNLTNIVT